MLNKNSNIMKSKLFFVALSAMALATSCSNDEVTELSDSNAIKYDLGIGKITRAADVYCNANKFTSFKVWANYTATGGTATPYIAGDVINFTNDAWADASGTRYWPNEGTLDFYALAGYEDPSLATGNTVSWTVDGTVAEQKDLCYAVKTNQSKTTPTVALNFRHALSQIVFKAKNKNAKLYVEIEEVGVCNVNSGATFTLPTANTDDNITDHPSATTPTIANQGSWALYTGAAKYTTAVFNTAVAGDGEVVNLTDNTNTATGHTGTNDYGKAMLLLPVKETTTAWNGEKQLTINAGTYTPAINDGTLILVKCKIWNVAGNSKTDDDVLLYGNADGSARWAAIPAAFGWEQGKKYIYTLVFDKGNGGIDPDPEDPDPVLVKIDYTVTVDDFVKGENYDIDMDEDGTQSTTGTEEGGEGGNSDN